MFEMTELVLSAFNILANNLLNPKPVKGYPFTIIDPGCQSSILEDKLVSLLIIERF